MSTDLKIIKKALSKKEKIIVLLAPSFAGEFNYPLILKKLRKRGFDKIVELTFGAKLVNKEYLKKLKNSKELVISSVCPGVVEFIKNKYPEYKKNLIKIDSPLLATAKVCKKFFPKHKLLFISPCFYKKIEIEKTKIVDYFLCFNDLKELIKNIGVSHDKDLFDKFYNDYTKIYPLSGGLTKTAHLKDILKKSHCKTIDGVNKIEKFLKKPNKKIKFLDITFCKGGCIGGPCTSKLISLRKKKKNVLKYMKDSKKEDIPENRKGLLKCASGISFVSNYTA